MTFAVLLVFGFGVILIASGLDNTPVVETFGKILNGTPIAWTGHAPTTYTAPGTPASGAPGAILPGPGKNFIV